MNPAQQLVNAYAALAAAEAARDAALASWVANPTQANANALILAVATVASARAAYLAAFQTWAANQVVPPPPG
jgi:hypothetical protein